MTCGSQHPDETSRTCLLTSATHGSHQDAQGSWPNREVMTAARVQRESKRGGRKGKTDNHRLLGEIGERMVPGTTQKYRSTDPSSSEQYGQPTSAKGEHRRLLLLAYREAGHPLTSREAMYVADLDMDTSAWTRVSEMATEGIIVRIETDDGVPIKRTCAVSGRTVVQYTAAPDQVGSGG